MSIDLSFIEKAGQTVAANPMAFILGVMALVAVLLLWVIQATKDNFDLRFLFTDDKTLQPSVHKMGELVSLIVSTWLIVYLAMTNHINETYFGMYMGIWAAAQVANKWVGTKAPPVNTTTSSTLVTQTSVAPTALIDTTEEQTETTVRN